IAGLLWFVVSHFLYPFFFAGLLLIAVISFIDDIKELSPALRFPAHLIAFLLMSVQAELFNETWWIVMIVLIVGLGAVNAFNFMDGINGITGLYALINLLTLLYIHHNIIAFTDDSLIFYILIGVVIFL